MENKDLENSTKDKLKERLKDNDVSFDPTGFDEMEITYPHEFREGE